jgi:hypothetical protein
MVNPINSLHTLDLILQRDPVLSPAIKFISALTPNVITLSYTLRNDYDNTIDISHCCFVLDFVDDKPLFPLVTRLQGTIHVAEPPLDSERLRKSIVKLLYRRSNAGAVPLELETFSIDPGIHRGWLIQFTVTETKLPLPPVCCV